MKQTTDAQRAALDALAQRLGLSREQAEQRLRDYPKPLWYINYRLDTGQKPEAPIPAIER